MDYPDPDVIRIENIYYMVATTMHFMPGCEILRSYDLVHWEHVCYVYDALDYTSAQKLEGDQNIYGRGMWAASLRYNNGIFYVCFVANDTRKTYLYQATDINGPWEKSLIEGFYHDCSLLFDEDDRVYIVYGNKDIWLTELEKDLSKPKEGGLHRMIVQDEGNSILGYEGAHIYKIKGRYYVFFIHSDPTKWKRIEACFVSDSLEGTFRGGDVLNDDRGYHNQGIAQGGIVDTPEGDWYSILFQDRGAVGRIPVLVPVSWKNDFPVFGVDGKVPQSFVVRSRMPDYVYQPLVGCDEFHWQPDGHGISRPSYIWQWNHEPDHERWSVDSRQGIFRIQTGKISRNLLQSVNTLTQRMSYPSCTAYVTVDGSELKDGDYAGMSALIGGYGLIAITISQGQYYLSMQAKDIENTYMGVTVDNHPSAEYERILINDHTVTLQVKVNFSEMIDEVEFSYLEDNVWKKLGITHKLYFKLDHFTGCRFGLFCYSTESIGGIAKFRHFVRCDEVQE